MSVLSAWRKSPLIFFNSLMQTLWDTPNFSSFVIPYSWKKSLFVNWEMLMFNPSTPHSDRHLVSSYSITSESNIKVMSIEEMIYLVPGSNVSLWPWKVWVLRSSLLTKFSLLIPQEMYREKCGESTYWSVLGRNGSRVLGAPSPLNLLFLCFAHSDLMNQVAIRQLVLWRKMPFQ